MLGLYNEDGVAVVIVMMVMMMMMLAMMEFCCVDVAWWFSVAKYNAELP